MISIVLAAAMVVPPPTPAYPAAATITAERLRSHLAFLASDELEGRDTPSRGFDIACLYVEAQLKLWGLKPAGEKGTYSQQIKLLRRVFDPDASQIEWGGRSLPGSEWAVGGTGPGRASGKLVYVGHGYRLNRKGIDPYRGVDLKGNVMVVTDGFPAGCSTADLDTTAGSKDLAPLAAARELGAVGILVVPRTDFFRNVRSALVPRPRFGLASAEARPSAELPRWIAAPALIAALFEGERISAADVGRALPPSIASFALNKPPLALTVSEKEEIAFTRNIVAVVPGSDAKLRNEYVGIGAHLDHVGVDGTLEGDRIYNGADDNGSGSAALLEIAHAFSRSKAPKRSQLLIWFGAEENGLWGSRHFVANPTVPLASIVAFLNMDMVGKSKPAGANDPKYRDLTEPDEVHPRGLTKMSSLLERTVREVNAKFLKLRFNMANDDGLGSGRMPGGSDHQSFFEKGIPTFAWHTGFHEDYHGKGDEIAKIDFAKMAKIAQTTYAVCFELGNARSRPIVDRPQVRVDTPQPVVRLRPNASVQLSASIKERPTAAFDWKIETPGGGQVTSSGLYTAPAEPGRYRVRASLKGEPGIYGIQTIQVDAAVPGQVPSPIRDLGIPVFPSLQNGGAESGLGEVAVGWFLVDESAADGYAAVRSDQSPYAGSHSLLLYLKSGQPKAFGNVRQAVAMQPFLGKRVRFSAYVRIEPGSLPTRAQLWVRIEGKQRKMLALDTMAERPITNRQWQEHEIVLGVPPDAELAVVGLMLVGNGRAWLDGAKLEALPDSE